MPTFDQLFSTAKEYSILLTAGTAAALVPRFGPGLAVLLALRSRFAARPVPQSIRLSEVKRVSASPGVITVKVPAGESEKSIVADTLDKLTTPPFGMRPKTNAPRVIYWYRLFTRGRSPIVVLEASEKRPGQEYAELAGAVRNLVDKYNLRVVVDGSPNSLDETLLRTKRQRTFDIKPLAKEMIWQVEQFQELFKYVKKAGLDDIVFGVLGGNPADFEDLWDNVKADLQNGQDAREVIGAHLCDQIYAAIDLVRDSKKKTNDMKAILELFDKDRLWMQSDILDDKDLERPTPDKVFLKVELDGVSVLVPASNAIGIVLRHSLTKKPSLDELEGLMKRKM